MLYELLKYHPMQLDFDSGWIPAEQEGVDRKKYYARSVQLIWKFAVGELSGSLKLSATNDPDNDGTGVVYTIDKISNTDDPLFIMINPQFQYLRFEYSAGGITSGGLFVNIYHEK